MPNTICTPTRGRPRLAVSGLFLSVLGRPVAESFGSFSATIAPHNSAPQFAIRTVALPDSVSHFPVGSAANAAFGSRAGIDPQTSDRAAMTVAALREYKVLFMHSPIRKSVPASG